MTRTAKEELLKRPGSRRGGLKFHDILVDATLGRDEHRRPDTAIGQRLVQPMRRECRPSGNIGRAEMNNSEHQIRARSQ